MNELEDRIQQDCVKWYNNTYCLKIMPDGSYNNCRSLIFHVPNQGQERFINIGVLPGVSDLIIVHRASALHNGIHIYIEMKRPKQKLKREQPAFEERILTLGYEYYIVDSINAFKTLIHSIHERELKTQSNYQPKTKALRNGTQ